MNADIGDIISAFAQWLIGILLYIPEKVWQLLLEALAAIIAAIPVPSFVTTFSANAGALPGNVVWFLDVMQFKAGVGMVATALLLRFLLRRIPFIGG